MSISQGRIEVVMKRKRTIRVFAILVCVYLAFTTIQGTFDLLSSGEKVTRRENVLAKLTVEKNDLLRSEKRALTNEFLEKTAYDELGLAKPGEKVFIIPSELLAENPVKSVAAIEPNWKKWANLIF